jgi:hypothetical protein
MIVEKNTDHKIIDSYLYLIKAKYFTVRLPKSGLYPGYHLNKCIKFGIEFDLIEEFETETTYNYYREIILETYKLLSNEDFKNLWVRIIGKMERSISDDFSFKFDSVKEEKPDIISNRVVKKDNYYFSYTVKETVSHVRDQLPLANQIKSAVYDGVADQIQKLDLNDEDIVQINTDSIHYYGKRKEITDKEMQKLKKDFNGWKPITIPFKSINGAANSYQNDNIIYKTLNIVNNNNQPRILHQKYAGNGKTYYIINQLIPRLRKENISYIVLTPTHSTLEEYKSLNIKSGFSCEIIQKFCFDGTIPTEEYIIIDEIGFCGAEIHDFLFKINRDGKAFECFGDFNQLLGVGETRSYNQPHYLKYMFNEIRTEFENFRNNFTKDYYDSLINSKSGTYLLKEVKKYSTPLELAEVAICFRNKTRDSVNKEVLKEFGLEPFSVGTKLVCVTNRLGEQFNIWNHKQVVMIKKYISGYTVKKNEPIYSCILKDSNGQKIDIPLNRVIKNFRHAYCINIYEAQGKTFKSYYWVEEDDIFIEKYWKNNRIAYTLISRIHQQVSLIRIIGTRMLREIEHGKIQSKKFIRKQVTDGDLDNDSENKST